MKRLLVALAVLPVPAFAGQGQNGAFIFSAVPTLDELGLGLLITLVAGAAGWAIRRKHRK